VPDVCVIFISAFDMFRSGLPLYHVKKIVMETGQIVEDGLTEIYANAVIDNGSKFSKLMKVFTENDTYNTDEFPVTSEIKARFKFDEGGAVKMDETLQRWMRESEEIGEKRGKKLGRQEGAEKEKFKIARSMREEGVNPELITKFTGLPMEVVMAL
ncbi:MAG: hypothetical protein ACFNTU_06145, partial [Catonella sp.]